jgi:hypothetical protein
LDKVFPRVTGERDCKNCKSQQNEAYAEAQPANQKFLKVVGREVEFHDQPDGRECQEEYDKFGITGRGHDISSKTPSSHLCCVDDRFVAAKQLPEVSKTTLVLIPQLHNYVHAVTYKTGLVDFNEVQVANRVVFGIGFAFGCDQLNSVSLKLQAHDRKKLVHLLTAMPWG